MPREQFENLTEPMYYVLLSLLDDCCGVDIMESVLALSKGRVRVGPGTLYSLLSKFEKQQIIKETSKEGRRINYIITEKGKKMLREEYRRLVNLVQDGELIKEVIIYE